MGDIVNLHDHTKLCCGPFCAECETAMVKQDEEVARLTARIARLQAEVRAYRARLAWAEIGAAENSSDEARSTTIRTIQDHIDARAAVDQHKDLEPQ